MKREDFVFSLGYQGESAIVDGQAKNQYKNLSTAELADLGLFRAAFNSALFSDDNKEIDIVIQAYNRKSGADIATAESMKRLLGIFSIPENIVKVTLI